MEKNGGMLGKRYEKMTENEGKSLKTGGKWRKMEETENEGKFQNGVEMEENGEKWRNARKKVGKKRQKMTANRWKQGEMEEN